MYFCHLERGGKGGAVLFLAQGGPVHLVAVDVDFPPLAVLHAIVHPARAEQCAVHEVLVQRVPLGRNPIVAVFHIINVLTVSLVLPTMLLPVVKHRTLAGATTLPCADDGSLVVFCYLHVADNTFFGNLHGTILGYGYLVVRGELLIVDGGNVEHLHRRRVLIGMEGEGHLVAADSDVGICMVKPLRTLIPNSIEGKAYVCLGRGDELEHSFLVRRHCISIVVTYHPFAYNLLLHIQFVSAPVPVVVVLAARREHHCAAEGEDGGKHPKNSFVELRFHVVISLDCYV